MAGSIGNIDFVFNLVKELDVFIDSIPSKLKLSARHKVLIREYSLACLLHAICSGRGEFLLESNIRETVSLLELQGEKHLSIAVSALQGEILTLIKGLKSSVLLSPAVQGAFYDVYVHAEQEKVTLAGLLLSGSIDTVLKASSNISLRTLLGRAEFHSELSADHTVELKWDSPRIAEMVSLLPPPNRSSVQIETVFGNLYIVVYRLFSQCAQVTLHDMSSMTLEDFFFVKK